MINIQKHKQTIVGIGIGLCISQLIALLQRRRKKNVKQIQMEDNNELIEEQLTRNKQFFGTQNQQKIRDSYILVFGAGGVGSHAINSFLRAGVNQIGIVDFDRVTLSSLNRHAIATREHVGKSKVEIYKEFAQQINPKAQLILWETYVTELNIEQFFLNKKPDYVVDCIDNIQAKAALIAYCVKNDIKIIVSCGAGMKSDPTRIQIRDVSESNSDGLARAIRMKLKKYHIKTGFNMVFSYEQNDKELIPLAQNQLEALDDYKIMPKYRMRIVPVFGCMPALIAYSLASYVLCDLGNQTIEPHKQDDIKISYYEKLYALLFQKSIETKSEFDLDLEDICLLSREVYEQKCLLLNRKCQLSQCVQWNPELPITVHNIALMNRLAAGKHRKCKKYSEVLELYDETVLQRKKMYDAKLVELLQKNKKIFV